MYSKAEETEITSIIISCINSYGKNGVPLSEIQDEFESLCGYPIPYTKFGYQDISSFLTTLPNVYVVKDVFNNDIVIEHSPKSNHIKDLISKQKNNNKRKILYLNDNSSNYFVKRQKISYQKSLPQGSSIHSSYNKKCWRDSSRFEEFQKLEEMLPVLYKHQALGDEFFVDLADKKLGYYVADTEPRRCGVCEVGLTIAKLTEKVKNADQIAPRVVVMVGMNDLLNGRNANNMILDLRKLMLELKRRNTRVTLITMIPSPKLKMTPQISMRMDIYNKAILEYGSDDSDENIFQGRIQINNINNLTEIIGYEANPNPGVNMDGVRYILKLGGESKVFVLEELEEIGKVVLVYINSRYFPNIWIQTKKYEFNFLSDDFTTYFRMSLHHLGIPFWQIAYTSNGTPDSSKMLFRLMVPALLPLNSKIEESRKKYEKPLDENSSNIPLNKIDSGIFRTYFRTLAATNTSSIIEQTNTSTHSRRKTTNKTRPQTTISKRTSLRK